MPEIKQFEGRAEAQVNSFPEQPPCEAGSIPPGKGTTPAEAGLLPFDNTQPLDFKFPDGTMVTVRFPVRILKKRQSNTTRREGGQPADTRLLSAVRQDKDQPIGAHL